MTDDKNNKDMFYEYWKDRPRELAATCGEKSHMVQITPKDGEFIILASDDWRIFEYGSWRQMTEEEQLEASL